MSGDIIFNTPPNYAQVKEHFGLSESDVMKGIVFAYYPNIYKPNGKPVTDHVVVHEKVHLKQQYNYSGGAQAWWKRYMEDKEFCLSQEVEACQAQLLFIYQTKRKGDVNYFLRQFAETISGPIYGHMTTYEDAVRLISAGPKA